MSVKGLICHIANDVFDCDSELEEYFRAERLKAEKLAIEKKELKKELDDKLVELFKVYKVKKEITKKFEKEILVLEDRLMDKFTHSKPKTLGSINYNTLKKILIDKTDQYFFSDNLYKLVTLNSMKEFLKMDKTDTFDYTSTWYDCDDFAYRLQGNLSVPGWSDIAAGIAWSARHAFNFFIDANKQVWIIEPQSDKLIRYEEAGSFYVPFRMVII